MIKIITYIALVGFIVGSVLFSRAGKDIKNLIASINSEFLTFLPHEVRALFVITFALIMISLVNKFRQ